MKATNDFLTRIRSLGLLPPEALRSVYTERERGRGFFARNAPTCFLSTVYTVCGRRHCRRDDRRPRRVKCLQSEFLGGSRLVASPWPIRERLRSVYTERERERGPSVFCLPNRRRRNRTGFIDRSQRVGTITGHHRRHRTLRVYTPQRRISRAVQISRH